MIPGGLNPMLLSAGGGGYQVQRSLRPRRAASGHLNRVFANGSATQWSHSQWMKRGAIDAFDPIFVSSLIAGEGAYFHSDNTLVIANNGAVLLKSNAVFRDPTAHMHIVFISDMANATAALRFRVFINNVELTSWATDVRASYSSWIYWNRAAASQHYIGYANALGAYSDSYRSDIVHVDAAVLAPSSFGQADASGNWVPKEYAGAYGTTGFRLKLDDPTSLTTLMADSSGNGNNWTANNISLTAGATYDSMLDVPLGAGGNERGNYCTWNPLDSAVSKPTNGNLRVGANAGEASRGTIFQSSGKWYFEFQLDVLTVGAAIGIGKSSAARSQYPGFDAAGYGYNPNTGNKINAGSGVAYGAAFGTSDIIGIAYDLDSGKIWWSKNGVWQASGDPAAGTNPAFTGVTGEFAPMFGIDSGGAGNGGHANFGQRSFAYTPPAGFKALHTGNLTSDTVVVSGSFTGNLSADGHVVWMNGAPETLTINGNAVTWGTHADKTAGGFKLRTSSSSYNSSGTNTWAATVLTPASKSAFRKQLAKTN